MPGWITCREIVEFLDDYLSKALSPDRAADFEYHLSNCPPCVAYMNGYREAVRLGKAVLEWTDEPAPGQIPEGLVRAILAARPKRT